MNSNICAFAFKSLNCTAGKIYPCCAGWLKPSINELLVSHNPRDIWFNDLKPFRTSILDGSYKYCSDTCPVRNTANLQANESHFYETEQYPAELTLSYDITCNLACKGCRKGIMTSDTETINKYEKLYSELVE